MIDKVEIITLDLFTTLISVASAAPAPRLPQDPVVRRMEDALADGKTAVNGPTLDLFIQAPDQVALRPAQEVEAVVDPRDPVFSRESLPP